MSQVIMMYNLSKHIVGVHIYYFTQVSVGIDFPTSKIPNLKMKLINLSDHIS